MRKQFAVDKPTDLDELEHEPESLSLEVANELVIEHRGWAESIARSVARAWNMDWRLDGLDGAAMEALIFCSRRFDASRGVPFRGYSRRRIHEASTEQARRSRGWKRSYATLSPEKQKAREVSAELFEIFPELREGRLPESDDNSDSGTRSSIRQVLMGATLLASRDTPVEAEQEDLIDFKKAIGIAADLDNVHQFILFKVYWEGMSLRSVAAEWETEGLNVVREHRTLLDYLSKKLSGPRRKVVKPKVRPGLRDVAKKLQSSGKLPPFTQILNSVDTS
jgi:DNA-directed RNA polymerase specialized sigma subunit